MIFNDCIRNIYNKKENKNPAEEKPVEKQSTDAQSKSGQTFCCMECGKRFASNGAYLLHLKEVHGL